MIHDFYSALRRKFEKRKTDVARAILSGSPNSWEEYKSFLGKLRGMEELDALLISLFKDWEAGKEIQE